MIDLKKLHTLEEILISCGKGKYAEWLRNCEASSSGTRIAVTGEAMKGKSTFINMLLGENIMPVSIIPTECSIRIVPVKPNEKIGKYQEDGKPVEESAWEDALESDRPLTIKTNNAILTQLKAMVTECPYLAAIRDDTAFLELTDLCSCNCAILVTSAEQLLGASEAAFLEYFSQYTSPSRVMVVINKLDLIPSGEVGNVLRYAETKLLSQFPGVRCAVVQEIPRAGLNAEQWLIGTREIINAIWDWTDTTDQAVQTGISYVLRHISELTRNDRDHLEESILEQKNIERQAREQINRQKELDQTEAERISAEFQRRQYAASDKIRKYLEDSLNQAGSNLFTAYKKTANKKVWCEAELERQWKTALTAASKRAERFACETIAQDIDYLNQQLPEQLVAPGKDFLKLGRTEAAEVQVSDIVNYGPYQKYVLPIGIGGGAAIGFCFFNIIGTTVCLAGGVLGALVAKNILDAKSGEQDARVKECIVSSVSDLKQELSRQAERAIEETYETARQQFVLERKQIIDTHYSFSQESGSAEASKQLEGLNQFLQIIEEVQ